MKHTFARYLCLLAMVLSSTFAMADGFTLKGKVIDEDGQALELVTVSCLAQGKVAVPPSQRVYDRPDCDAPDGGTAGGHHYTAPQTDIPNRAT